MMEELRIYTKLIKIGFKSMLQFRADFIMGLLGILMLGGVTVGSAANACCVVPARLNTARLSFWYSGLMRIVTPGS